MNNLIDNINLIDGLNLNPIPLEFSQQLTTTKYLGEIEHKINRVIDIINSLETNSTKYTDQEVKKLRDELKVLYQEIYNGDIIKDGSISLKKLNKQFLTDLQGLILEYVHDSVKFVTFGLVDGHFVANIPRSWSDITFSTNGEGQLVLTM